MKKIHDIKKKVGVRRPRALRPKQPGDIIQIDTVHLTLAPGKTARQFTAYCPVARWTVARAFRRATAHAAKAFLEKVIRDMPFPVPAIQVDGGSEFMAEFEQECKRRGISLLS